jgi:hypothetical protein
MSERFFIEQEIDNTYRIAVIDIDRIYNSTNPGTLATVFECSLSNPSDNDRAEIYYALAPSIGADYIFADIKEKYRTCKLNNWSISIKDNSSDNIFSSLSPLDINHRIQLYSKQYSITPEQTITSASDSLFSLLDLSKQLSWKTGILQRCIDSLVYPQYRKNPKVYSCIDLQYRRVMRFKYETEFLGIPLISDGILVEFIRKITSSIGLKHSRDNTSFIIINDNVSHYINFIETTYPVFYIQGDIKDKLSYILCLWIGSTIIEINHSYKLELNDDVTEALSYTTSLLVKPEKLVIIDAPM